MNSQLKTRTPDAQRRDNWSLGNYLRFRRLVHDYVIENQGLVSPAPGLAPDTVYPYTHLLPTRYGDYLFDISQPPVGQDYLIMNGQFRDVERAREYFGEGSRWFILSWKFNDANGKWTWVWTVDREHSPELLFAEWKGKVDQLLGKVPTR